MSTNHLSFPIDESLRQYQQECKTNIYNAWYVNNVNRVMLQMPTATGKTRVFTSIIKDHISSSHQVSFLVLVHRNELVQQTCEHLKKYKIPHGKIDSENNYIDGNTPVYVAMVQTLVNRVDKLSEINFDYIIIDEAHHTLADSYKSIIKRYNQAKILGLTATPYRLNGEGFTKEYDLLLTSKTVQQFISEGYLSKFHYVSIKNNSPIYSLLNSITETNISGDYSESAMMRCMARDSIRAGIVESYFQFAKGKKGIIYTINKDHNKQIVKKYQERGIRAVGIDSSTPSTQREQYIREFKEGTIDIICNVNIFSEGFDCPDVEFIQLARPTLSLSMFLQQVGRGLRITENKQSVIILDNVGLYHRFGLPNREHNWQKHFEGYYRKHSESPLYRPSNYESIDIEWMDYNEGNEEMQLIDSPLSDLLPLDSSCNFENEFFEYMCRPKYIKHNSTYYRNYGEQKQSNTALNYISAVHNHINMYIKNLYMQDDVSLFNTVDPECIQNIFNKLNSQKTFFIKNNKRKNLFNNALNAYIRFATNYKKNLEIFNIINSPNISEEINSIQQQPADILSLISNSDKDITELTLRKLGLPSLEKLIEMHKLSELK